MIAPSRTITAPTGTSPRSIAARASKNAQARGSVSIGSLSKGALFTCRIASRGSNRGPLDASVFVYAIGSNAFFPFFANSLLSGVMGEHSGKGHSHHREAARSPVGAKARPD